jgi:hypothetical protein
MRLTRTFAHSSVHGSLTLDLSGKGIDEVDPDAFEGLGFLREM